MEAHLKDNIQTCLNNNMHSQCNSQCNMHNNQLFRIVDSWANRSNAHRSISMPWVGTTAFLTRDSTGENCIERPSLQSLSEVGKHSRMQRCNSICGSCVGRFESFPFSTLSCSNSGYESLSARVAERCFVHRVWSRNICARISFL